jgi:hypothetical protein
MPAFVPTSEQIDCVHDWRARRPDDRVREALVPLLRRRFDLTAAQAVAVARAAGNEGGSDAKAAS